MFEVCAGFVRVPLSKRVALISFCFLRFTRTVLILQYMNRAVIIAALKSHEVELKQLGVVKLSPFGSTARDEARPTSDVDLAVTLAPGRRGLTHLERMDRIKARLSAIVGCPLT